MASFDPLSLPGILLVIAGSVYAAYSMAAAIAIVLGKAPDWGRHHWRLWRFWLLWLLWFPVPAKMTLLYWIR